MSNITFDSEAGVVKEVHDDGLITIRHVSELQRFAEKVLGYKMGGPFDSHLLNEDGETVHPISVFLEMKEAEAR